MKHKQTRRKVRFRVELVSSGNGVYNDLEFVWDKPIGVTALKFFNSTSLGKKYEKSIFVGDANMTIYKILSGFYRGCPFSVQ